MTLRPRIILSLIYESGRIIKGQSFQKHEYIGDAKNILRIFNEKQVDEVLLISKGALSLAEITRFSNIVNEAYMPVGIACNFTNVYQIEQLFELGIEKCILSSGSRLTQGEVRQLANTYGSQSLGVLVDYKNSMFRQNFFYGFAFRKYLRPLPDLVKEYEQFGFGEVIVQSQAHEGRLNGVDAKLMTQTRQEFTIPVVYSGGIQNISQVKMALKSGYHSVAIGAWFTYSVNGNFWGIMPNYLSRVEKQNLRD